MSEVEILEPEAHIDAPRPGTLAWLQLQEHVELLGLSLPIVHRVPEGATLVEADGPMCRVMKLDGHRCRAPGTRLYGLCIVHLGGGMQDPAAVARKGWEARSRLKVRRQLLGISASSVGNPRQHARLRALERAEELAEALVDGPLDDVELGSIARQAAVVRALDATFPLQATTVEVELPVDPEGVQQLGWEDMQVLAARLLET